MSISNCTATSNDYYAVNSLVREGHEEHVREEPAIFKSVESVMPESYFKDLLEDQNRERLYKRKVLEDYYLQVVRNGQKQGELHL